MVSGTYSTLRFSAGSFECVAAIHIHISVYTHMYMNTCGETERDYIHDYDSEWPRMRTTI